MTDPADFDTTETGLPGLGQPDRPESKLQAATRQSIRALEAAGFLDETHAVLCQLMLDMAEAVDVGRRTGKASAAAMAAAQILAAYQLMVPESGRGGDSDEWTELVAQVRRGAAAVRDTF